VRISGFASKKTMRYHAEGVTHFATAAPASRSRSSPERDVG
jgi:hypothetical protein